MFKWGVVLFSHLVSVCVFVCVLLVECSIAFDRLEDVFAKPYEEHPFTVTVKIN